MTEPHTLSGRVARNFMALGAGESGARILAFLATIYIARVLGPVSYGVIGFAGAIMLYLARLADAGIEVGLGIRELAATAPDRRPILISSLATGRFALAVVSALLLAVGALVFAPEPERSVFLILAIVLVFQGLSTKWVHLGLERTRLVGGARIAGELTMIAVVLLFVRNPGDVATVPIAQAAGEVVLIGLFAVALRRTGERATIRVDVKTIKPLIPRALPLMTSALLGLVIYNSDLLFLRLFRDSAAVGFYAAAYGLISFFISMGAAYQQSLLPMLSRHDDDDIKRTELFGTSAVQVLAIALPATVGIFLYAPDIIQTAFGDEYAASAPALAWLSISVLFLLNRSVPNVALLARGREDHVLRVNVLATVVNIAANLTLIPGYGILGAAWSTVITEVFRWFVAWMYAASVGFRPTAAWRSWRPIVATAAMWYVVATWFDGALWTGSALGALTYVTALAVTGGVGFANGRPYLKV